MIIYNLYIDTMLENSRFLDLTAVNMQKNVFLAIFWIYTLTNSIPLQLSNSLLRQLSNLLTLQLTSSPTHLLTYLPTLSTIGGSTSSSLVFIRKWFIRKYYYIGQNLKKVLVLPPRSYESLCLTIAFFTPKILEKLMKWKI